jgi:hypothetical protein
MNTQLAPGDTEYRDFGPLHIRIDRHEDGVAITVVTPARTTLDRAFTNLDEGRAYLTFLRDAALAGLPVWAIEQQAGVLTSAAAVIDDAEQALIDGINADWDRNTKQATAIDVSDIVDGDEYQAARKAARADAARYSTRTGAHLKPPSAAELDRMRQHHNGVVTCAPGQPWTLLRAIVRRGLAVEHEVHGRHVLKAVRLNARGYQAIESSEEKAA